MNEITGKDRGITLTPDGDSEVVRRVAGGREQPDMIIECMVAGDQFGPSCFDDWENAVPHHGTRRLTMDAIPVFVFLLREQIARSREGRDPAAVFKPRVPTDMIAM